MSTLKAVLMTSCALFLGMILLGLSSVVWAQYQQIQELQVRVSSLHNQVNVIQEQANLTSDRLSKSIRTTNKNFGALTKREDKMSDILEAVCGFILSGSGRDPAVYKNPNASGE
jgi:hypothetical protein